MPGSQAEALEDAQLAGEVRQTTFFARLSPAHEQRTIQTLQSRASWPLLVTTAVVMMIGAWLPFSPIGPALGFEPLPPQYWPLLVLTLVGYAFVTQLVKEWLLGHRWI